METGLHVEGLTEALRGLAKVDKEASTEARDALRVAARDLQQRARARMGGRPGGGTYPRRGGMIGYAANQKGGAIKLAGARYPWAYGAEYGARRAWVWGNRNIQSNLRRRQFPIWRGNQFVVRGSGGPGWIIQPTIRQNLDRILADVAEGMSAAINKAVTRG